MNSVIYTLVGIGGFIVMAATFYYTFIRPRNVKRGRAIDKLMGSDGSDGLPVEKSIWQRLDEQDGAIAGVAEVQADMASKIDRLLEEFPKNGIPARQAVDQIREDLKRYQAREDRRWGALVNALVNAQITPPKVED